MKKYLIIGAGILFLGVPPVVFASGLTITPSTYSPPAQVNYTGANGVNYLELYDSTNPTGLPICEIVNTAETGNLNADCPAFDYASSTNFSYDLTQPYLLGCNGVEYVACQTTNSGMEHALFSVYPSSTTPTSTATSSLSDAETAFYNNWSEVGIEIFFLIEIGFFCLALWLIWKGWNHFIHKEK